MLFLQEGDQVGKRGLRIGIIPDMLRFYLPDLLEKSGQFLLISSCELSSEFVILISTGEIIPSQNGEHKEEEK